MGRNLDDIIKSMPAGRQAKIAALAQTKIEEMIASAATLTDFRKAVGKTQVEVARELGIKQHAVSQLENRTDTYVSTLRRFLKSLGMTLELSVIAKDGTRIDLPNFLPGNDNSSIQGNSLARANIEKSPHRKTAVKSFAARKVAAKTASKNRTVSTTRLKSGTTTTKSVSRKQTETV